MRFECKSVFFVHLLGTTSADGHGQQRIQIQGTYNRRLVDAVAALLWSSSVWSLKYSILSGKLNKILMNRSK